MCQSVSPARPFAEGGQATSHHIYHRGSYGMDTGIDLLFAQHPKFPAWASAVPIEQDAPVFFPPMKLVRLSAGIQDILRPVSKMANTSDRLVSEHTVKEMGYDELLLLHPPVTAGERARRVRGYLAPPWVFLTFCMKIAMAVLLPPSPNFKFSVQDYVTPRPMSGDITLSRAALASSFPAPLPRKYIKKNVHINPLNKIFGFAQCLDTHTHTHTH